MKRTHLVIGLFLAVTFVLGQSLWEECVLAKDKNSTRKSNNPKDDFPIQEPHFLREYVDFHHRHRGDPEARYLVWRCGNGCGGTGDRIKGIVTTFYTAICSRRVLLIDWPEAAGHPLVRYLVPNSIDWRVPSGTNIDLTSAKVVGKSKRMHGFSSPVLKSLQLPLHLANETLLSMMTNRWYQDEMPDEHWYGGDHNSSWYASNSHCLQSLWSLEPKDSSSLPQEKVSLGDNQYLFRLAFRFLFRFSDLVEKRAQWIRSRTTQLGGSRYLAVHIRTGGAFDDPGRHTSEGEYEKFFRCAKRLQQRLHKQCRTSQEPWPIYLASDDRRVKEVLLSMEQQATTGTTEQSSLHTLPDLALYHIDQPHLESDPLAATEGELTVWAELLVLLQSTCLVTSTSGFSQIASWLQWPICSIHFEDCESAEHVTRALEGIKCSGA